MQFRDTDEEARFRQEFRAWLTEHIPVGEIPLDDDDHTHYQAEWERCLFKGGWVGLSWPVEYGGRGLSPVYEAILNDELGAAGAPPAPNISHLGRAILTFGDEEQKRAHLPGLLSGEVRWCQGFSEPGAGSDLAAISTKAVLDGDDYVVTGQKVWTSDARWADWCLLLARTGTTDRRHEGISAFVLRMDTPGVTVRPIVQITGSREFCEVFFDEAKAPVSQRIGEPGVGWELAMTTLTFERGPADIGFISRFRRSLGELVVSMRAGETRDTPALRVRLARAYVAVEVLRLHVLRSLSARAAGVMPGPESSVDKQLMTAAEQELAHAALDLFGAAPLIGGASSSESVWLRRYLWSRAASIYGGSEQIQRNILATRVLGLPRS